MNQKKITAEEELRCAAIDCLIEAYLVDRYHALEFMLARWRNVGTFDSDKFTIAQISPKPQRLPIFENTIQEKR